jgi:hypothetical protein
MTHFDNHRITRTHLLPQQKFFHTQLWMCQYITPLVVVAIVVVAVVVVVVSIVWVKAQ